MSQLYTVHLDLPDIEQQMEKLGLGKNNEALRFFANELMRMSDPYVPFRSGVLKNTAQVSSEGDAIIYNQPYARYMWYGKLMVDPVYGVGGFYNEQYGFWSRKNVQKVLTNRDLNYSESPRRGAKWVERCWIENKEQLIASTQAFIDRRVK